MLTKKLVCRGGPLDFHLVSDRPAPMYVGSFPSEYDAVPARVFVNVSGMYRSMTPQRSIMFALPFHDSEETDNLPSRADIERLLYGIDLFAANEPSFWHCASGFNRSGFFAAAYIHLCRRVPVTAAIAALRERRHRMMLCNPYFEAILVSWYGNEAERSAAGLHPRL